MHDAPGRRGRPARPALLALAVTMLTAACAGAGAQPAPRTPPATTSPTAAVTGKWSSLDAACPTLTGQVANQLKKTGPGKPGAADADTPVAQNANCTWGAGGGSVGVSLRLNRADGPLPADQATAQQFQTSFDGYVADGSIVHWKPEPDLEDKAYLAVHKDRVTIELWVLSSNASLTVYHQVSEVPEAERDTALARHRATLRGLAADVLDDLS